MAIRDLTASYIDSLIGTRHTITGFEYPPNGLQPYYQWLVNALHLLAEASAGGLRIDRDEANDTTVNIAPGRAALDGVVLVYSGGISDLATFNNDTVYVWLYDNAGAAAISKGSAVVGWPVTTHIKLAEVSLSAGLIINILDRRHETIFSKGIDPSINNSLVKYSFNILT